ncbi:ClpP/crotonase-like domain-containing protein [Xylariaceae sp. AK1471]|nr:ClpP/crotonase-like domain-containing protein [Xylariaceae sp. AK1471]
MAPSIIGQPVGIPSPRDNILIFKSTHKVVIANSSNSVFFLNHIDLTSLTTLIIDGKKKLSADCIKFSRPFQSIMSAVFIAETDDRAFGAGHKIPAQMDIHFVGPGVRMSSFKEALGLIAREYLLTATDLRWSDGRGLGIYNKYYDDSKELTERVLKLAQRIALFPLDSESFSDIEQFSEEQANVRKSLQLSANQSPNKFKLGVNKRILALYGKRDVSITA